MGTLHYFDAAETHKGLPYASLIEHLRLGFGEPNQTPTRHHHPLWDPHNTLLLMPSWDAGNVGIKLISIYPDNPARRLPTIQGVYVLLDGNDGRPIAVADAAALTVRRTSAASALAATFLARKESRTLLMLGAGALAPHLVRAHAAVFPIASVMLWNRTASRAQQMAQTLSQEGFGVEVVSDLEAACRGADIISCATGSTEPLVLGKWVGPGTHVDLVGGYTPEMREVDAALVETARVFVDTREGALSEAGDLLQPIASGVFHPDQIQGDLFDLVRDEGSRRSSDDEITLFKSVGTAIEDLIAARLLLKGNA